MYACICHAVPTSQVRSVILAGARTVPEIGERCAAGTGCGGCVERLRSLLEESASQREEVGALRRSA